MNYWEWALEPIRMSDELYYVGTTKGPSHLLSTDDGLVLIDTGWPQSLYMLTDNIRSLGFDPADVRHIIHSHGHIDHFGGTRALVELSGAKTYIGLGDEEAAMGKNGLDYAEEAGRPFEEPFVPDVLIRDGDVLSFGKTEITFVSTPGHTKGTLSMFFDVHTDGRTYRAGMFGGAGLNTLERTYLDRHGLSDDCRREYLASVRKLLTVPVDFHLGNHWKDNGQPEKTKRLGEGKNPFVDPASWEKFLKAKEKDILALIEKERN